MAKETKTSMCRICGAQCGVTVDIEDNRILRVTGDVANPMFEGYTCSKGRALPEIHHDPKRLLRSLKRQPDGSFSPIAVGDAMDEVATILDRVRQRYGPRAVASYLGTYGMGASYPTAAYVTQMFLGAIGTPMLFHPGLIDQPGKPISSALHGRWNAGIVSFDETEVCLVLGCNTLVSMWGTIPAFNPGKWLRQAKQRGMQLIVMDPRRTETARNADLFLQTRPGEDPTLLAGLIRLLFAEGLVDRDFLATDVSGAERLRLAVERFDPDYVEQRTGISPTQLAQTARLISSTRKGRGFVGTGPNMALHGTLTEYLMLCLHTVLGWWARPGDVVYNPGVLSPAKSWKAQAEPRRALQDFAAQMSLRVRGLGMTPGGLPTSALADEILLEGDGQVRALLNIGGNPVAGWPDQLKTLDAMKSLDLLVAFDRRLTSTSKLAHYVIAPKIFFETSCFSRDRIEYSSYSPAGYPAPYAQYTPALVDPPEGSDVIEEWQFIYGLAQRMGLQLQAPASSASTGCGTVDLDMVSPPTTDDLYDLINRSARIPLATVKEYPHGHIFDAEPVHVEPADTDRPDDLRLEIGDEMMLAELAQVAADPILDHNGWTNDEPYAFRLISRRMLQFYNSSVNDVPSLTRKYRYNPAFMNPDDLSRLQLRTGDVVEITSERATILGVVEADADILPGVISMTHAWGDAPQHDADVRTIGSNTSRLTDVTKHFDPVTGCPVMSAIPVNVTVAAGAISPA